MGEDMHLWITELDRHTIRVSWQAITASDGNTFEAFGVYRDYDKDVWRANESAIYALMKAELQGALVQRAALITQEDSDD